MQPIERGGSGFDRPASSGRATATTFAPNAITSAASKPVRIATGSDQRDVRQRRTHLHDRCAVGIGQSARSG